MTMEDVIEFGLTRHTKMTREMCRIRQDVEYSGFILVNRNSLEPYIVVGCHRMSENSDFGLHKFNCIIKTEVLDHLRHR
jgi:hypothetical protein